jgi:Sulfotransferase domain.
MRLPDFIIGGAPRSGTTWLYQVLAGHPEIYMARPARPEPKFFLVDELYEKGLDHYAQWFSGAHAGQTTGEKSTNYLESGVAARRIRADLPSVKLIFVLRDPVERAYSNYLWSRMNGLEAEEFGVALALETKRERNLSPALRYARPFSYYARGLYADLLQPYLTLFPRGQLLVLRFEDISSDPESLVETVSDFLGVKPRMEGVATAGVVNASEKGDDAAMPSEARRQLSAAYAEPNRRLARLLGDGFRIWEPTS